MAIIDCIIYILVDNKQCRKATFRWIPPTLTL